MIAFKGFNSNLKCTMGKGTFQYEVGKVYKEDRAQCASTGFHCVEEPIEVLKWYSATGSRFCIVDARGDINEDGNDKISCTEMEIKKEISIIELAMLEVKWLQKHPERKHSNLVLNNAGEALKDFVIVRGKHPKAKGLKGTVLFLLKEEKNSKEIKDVAVFEVDGKEVPEKVYIRTDGRRARQ